MNLDTCKSILNNPYATAQQKADARAKLATLSSSRSARDAILQEALKKFGVAELSQISTDDMTKFVEEKGRTQPALNLFDRHNAELRILFWERLLRENRDDDARIVELTYDNAHTEAGRRKIAERELRAAKKEISEAA